MLNSILSMTPPAAARRPGVPPRNDAGGKAARAAFRGSAIKPLRFKSTDSMDETDRVLMLKIVLKVRGGAGEGRRE